MAFVIAVGIAVFESNPSVTHTTTPMCRVHVGSADFLLMLDQAANATTIAAVGKQLGMPDRAVTVALAAALQESGLHNLHSGDLDSLGLFQQRPSQGWGTPEEILTPSYAASAFFEHLARIDGWESAPVTVAAQAVQRSAFPSAYAPWEPRAQVLMQATTGEVAVGLGCQYPAAAHPALLQPLAQAMTQELGSPTVNTSVADDRGWTIATWLVAHADTYEIASVTFAGRTWTPATNHWTRRPPADPAVHITLLRPARG
jgi:hypothetical protein